jgi:two-component system response regulator AtoC
MTGAMLQILVIDDDEQVQFFLKERLQRQGYAVTLRDSAEAALESLRDDPFDLILLDLRLPGPGSLAAIDGITKIDQHVPIVVMTSHRSPDKATEAMRHGAYDAIARPFRLDEIDIVVRRAIERRRLQGEIDRLRSEIAGRPYGRIVGSSAPMRMMLYLLDRVAPTDTPVLIIGEIGTGKELAAEYIHEHSGRSDRPLVKVDLGAIPAALVDGELFGFGNEASGRIQAADGATILLDEIGAAPLATQARILRVLQDRTFEPVGAAQEVGVDVRVIASTSADLITAVRNGTFRDDLYLRLNATAIRVPPLRDRREEIPQLSTSLLHDANETFGRSVKRISPAAMAALTAYDWPCNLRELRQAVEWGVAVAEGDTILPSGLPPAVQAGAGGGSIDAAHLGSEGAASLSLDDRMDQLERAFLVDALTRAGGVQAAAARILGVSERSVWHLVKKHAVEIEKIKKRAARGGPRSLIQILDCP